MSHKQLIKAHCYAIKYCLFWQGSIDPINDHLQYIKLWLSCPSLQFAIHCAWIIEGCCVCSASFTYSFSLAFTCGPSRGVSDHYEALNNILLIVLVSRDCSFSLAGGQRVQLTGGGFGCGGNCYAYFCLVIVVEMAGEGIQVGLAVTEAAADGICQFWFGRNSGIHSAGQSGWCQVSSWVCCVVKYLKVEWQI